MHSTQMIMNRRRDDFDFSEEKAETLAKLTEKLENAEAQLDKIDDKIDDLHDAIDKISDRPQVVEYLEKLIVRLEAEKIVVGERIVKLKKKIEELLNLEELY